MGLSIFKRSIKTEVNKQISGNQIQFNSKDVTKGDIFIDRDNKFF